MSQTSTPVLVLGMHRSGTSFLASLLAGMGVHMGEELLAADSGNPRGYYEDVSVLAFHKKLLAARMGGVQTRADFLPPADFDSAWTPDEAAEADELISRLARPGYWGWKEPRSCLFISQWLERLPAALCVAIFRHPLEIYYSFLRRGDWSALFAPESIFEACALYNEAILAAREADPSRFLVLDAGAAFADIPALVARLAQFVGLPEAELSALPPFAAGEFASLGVVPEQHELMALVYPRTAAAYERMQAFAVQAAEFAPQSDLVPLPPALLDHIVAAVDADREDGECGRIGRIRLGQPVIDAFCLNVPQDKIAALRARMAQAVEAELAKASAERDEYVASFTKYKALYDNYFEAWHGSERTLAETREWINGDLIPKIERWRAQFQKLGIAYEE